MGEKVNVVDNTEFSCDAFPSNEESDYREGTWKATAALVARAPCIGPLHAEAFIVFKVAISTINNF